ncbi:hypothetical protein [uncultured Draconibacterium sp.]|uniref:hypothetical protein n=1 Tax=uncultured Draconibacterium sp. TaxID=1573823 RepID=UPI0032608B19
MTKSIKVVLIIIVIVVLAFIKMGFQAAEVHPGIIWVLILVGGGAAIRAIWKYEKE